MVVNSSLSSPMSEATALHLSSNEVRKITTTGLTECSTFCLYSSSLEHTWSKYCHRASKKGRRTYVTSSVIDPMGMLNDVEVKGEAALSSWWWCWCCAFLWEEAGGLADCHAMRDNKRRCRAVFQICPECKQPTAEGVNISYNQFSESWCYWRSS